MTKRLILAAVAWSTLGCGSDDPVLSDADAGRTGARDGGASAPETDAKTSTAIDPVTGRPPAEDRDADGFSPEEGDCNDFDDKVNPGAYDFPGDKVDDDCSGEPAFEGDGCDDELAIDSSDATDAARALGLCKFVAEEDRAWGVISARFTDATGSEELSDPLAVGLLPSFGAAKPSGGKSLLALSSGVARAPGQPGYTPECDALDASCPLLGLLGCTGGADAPMGYPKETSTCRAAGGNIFTPGTKVFNQAALELKIRVPNNAVSFSFDSIFYTYEFPDYVCSKFNDFYVVFKEPRPADLPDDNIVFDRNGDSIGVNTGLLAVCDASSQSANATKRFDCQQGTALLKGTGYGPGETTCVEAGGAATGWLHTKAPIVGGEIITLRFAIWDTGDAILDSTVLIDNFAWSTNVSQVGTEPILL
jgi:hypothetical protein